MVPLNISGGSLSRYIIRDDQPGALQIMSSEEKDHGKYECVAENTIGTDYSKPALLYVKVRRVPPQFSIPPPPIVDVKLGDDLNLTCVAVGSPMPFVKWRKGIAQEVTPEDKLPIALPAPPTNVRVSEITATSVRLTWSYSEPEDLQYYVIQLKPKNANQPFAEISGIITMYYSVRNLSPYTEYEMYVIAVNNIGRALRVPVQSTVCSGPSDGSATVPWLGFRDMTSDVSGIFNN
ncbi:hypothetical protein NQ317_015888 [Molorchus minor]|uniref:Uncharacterized protein n=1 Tax=Molorchus minor TaxID=1323400 RepID=A0ABQ9IV58_9CUCU|nr:hypothetical protein NQ317_015888 [Molorchus minor]